MGHGQVQRKFWIGAAALCAAAGMLAAADDLPKAETILDKYVEATGGKAAYAKVHTEVTTGTMEFPAMGLKGNMVSYAAEPDKHLVEMTIEGVGTIQDASDGAAAWTLSAVQGPHIKEGDEKAEALETGKFHADARWREIFQKVETTGVEQVDGKDCYKVTLSRKTGSPQTRWFDKQTNLLVRVLATVKSPNGEITSQSTFSDYRKEGDLLVAHKATMHAAGQDIVITVDKVQHNAAIPPEKFVMPAEIKALQKK